MLKETTWENGLKKEVCTDGESLTTNWYNRNEKLVKREASAPDEYGRIKYEETKNGKIETFANGRVVETQYHTNACNKITTYPNGTKEVKLDVMTIEGL